MIWAANATGVFVRLLVWASHLFLRGEHDVHEVHVLRRVVLRAFYDLRNKHGNKVRNEQSEFTETK